MILSRKHGFIFIKTRKTAGTSIEVALEKLCGDDGIVTPINPPVEGHSPRNYGPFRNHVAASVVRNRIGDELFSQSFKFCFERNPYDKVASAWRWQAKHIPFSLFCALCFLNYAMGELRMPSRLRINPKRYFFPIDWHIYSEDAHPIVDFIGRFESLDGDLQKALSSVGINNLPRLTNEKTTGRGNYRQLYNLISRLMVRLAFKREINHFGYSF